MLTADDVKKAARSFGADLVGIGSIDRWKDAPPHAHPATIMPRVKSIIGFGLRIHRGSFRGNEEGTFHSGYTLMGYSELNNHVSTFIERQIASLLEDDGYETTAYSYNSSRLGIDAGAPAIGPDGREKPRPDVFINFRIAGVLCGMGEIGYSRLFLSREYGPAQRLYFLLTEAELEPDPIQGGICDRCMQCVRRCPARALSTTRRDDLDIAGVRHIVRSALDLPRCITVNGGGLSQFAPEEIVDQTRNLVDGQGDRAADGTPYPSIREISEQQQKQIGYARNAQRYFASPASLCAGEGCMRACLAHLERKGALGPRFHRPFRPD